MEGGVSGLNRKGAGLIMFPELILCILREFLFFIKNEISDTNSQNYK